MQRLKGIKKKSMIRRTMSMRKKINAMSKVLAFVWVVTGIVLASIVAASEQFGAGEINNNLTGDPIGGGKGYKRLVTPSLEQVKTSEKLLVALKTAKAGQIVYVDDKSEINLSGYENISIPAGVTLASGRGRNGSQGALIYTDKLWGGADYLPLFLAASNARVTGLRIKGPNPKVVDINKDTPRNCVQAMRTTGINVEVDNCEISNFFTGVFVYSKGVHVHHSFFHDFSAYSVEVGNGGELPTLIEANLIHWSWHAIAGSGKPGTGYEARYNIAVLQNLRNINNSHCFDMHDFMSEGRIAGDRIIIHHNTVENMGATQGVVIRALPRDIAEVYNNWFSTEDPTQAVAQEGQRGNMRVYNNVYGPNKKLIR